MGKFVRLAKVYKYLLDYSQRPSQGLMNLERVMPLGGATDTTGVFSRSPYKWVKFSKAW